MDLKIIYLSPDELTPYEGNARKHAPEDIDQIKASIEADGFNDPIGIWGDRTAELSGWDFGKLEEEIARLEIEGVDLSGLQFELDGLSGGGYCRIGQRNA